MPWAQNLSVYVYIELFAGTLEILNQIILMMEYCSTDKTYVQYKKESCPLYQKTYIQIYYSEVLCPNSRMLHVPFDVLVLVLIA